MKKVLFIGKVWPEPGSSAAGIRLIQLIELFKEFQFEVVFASAAARGPDSADLQHFLKSQFTIEINNSAFDDFISDLDPDVVVFDRFTTEEQFGWRVTDHCPQALKILDTEDLHCLRAARQHALKKNKLNYVEDLHSDIAKREIASIYRSDLSLIISDFELNLLTEHFKIDKLLLFYIPLFAEAQSGKSLPDFEDRKNFVTIGNFLHPPNLDAVEFIKKEIWPGIRKSLPGAQIHNYGAYANDKVLALHDEKNGFLIKGRAKEVSEVMSAARVCLAPLRFGAGIKGKLLDAMRCGTPNVTTDIGTEGIKADLPWAGSIANNPQEITEAAISLYQHKTEWYQARLNGFTILEKRFSKKQFAKPFIDKILSLINNLESHRDQNFIGSMLQHHSMRSTKYMSLWIEAKNKPGTDTFKK